MTFGWLRWFLALGCLSLESLNELVLLSDHGCVVNVQHAREAQQVERFVYTIKAFLESGGMTMK